MTPSPWCLGLAVLLLAPAAARVHTSPLQWSIEPSRSLATHLVVEAGSTPGAANLATVTLTPDATTLVVPGVRCGTYYVRARAVNGTGPGEASNEITVVVT